MRASEIRAMVSPEWRLFDRRRRRLEDCNDIEELRLAANRVLPKAVFDYIAGGADDEVTLVENERAFRQCSFTPRALADVSKISLCTRVLGMNISFPLGLAPTGYTRMVNCGGEVAVASAARSCGVPYVLSTVGTTTIEEVAAVGNPALWFQLYILRDRGLTRSLIERAAAAGVSVLEVSVDTPVAGRRLRDLHNGFTIPPRLRVRTVADMVLHPAWWSALIAGPTLAFANVSPSADQGLPTVKSISELFDPSVTWDDLDEVRDLWPGPLLVKGPLNPSDARRAIEAGASGVHLSNHGGRQLDRATVPLDLLPAVRETLGPDATVVVDSGIRHGADVAVALALGADLCMVGRAYLYGLAVGGENGVRYVIDLLADQLRRTMQLCGITTIDDLRAAGETLVNRVRGDSVL